MNYYSTLHVDQYASQSEIKTAYRRLAARLHPDRGGDAADFQKIVEAYNVLSDPDEREWYDVNLMYEQCDTVSDDGQDTSEPSTTLRQKNLDLLINCQITLEQSYSGTAFEATYPTLSGDTADAIVCIPAGVKSGQVVRCPGLGDDHDPELPRGDLLIKVSVSSQPGFARLDDDLHMTIDITPIEAMIGCTKTVVIIDGSQHNIEVPAGTAHGKKIKIPNLGFKALGRATEPGSLVMTTKIVVPAVVDQQLRSQLYEIGKKI